MKQYWKIKELTALGYSDEVRRADEYYYGFDHSSVDDSLYTYRFSELLQSPYFRWLVLFNAKHQFDVSDADDAELAEFKHLYQPYQIEDRYLASELSQCFNFTRWYSEHQFLSDEDHSLLRQLAELADAVKLFSVSDQEKTLRDLLELVNSDDGLFFDRLAALLRTDHSDDNLKLNVGNHDLEKTGLDLQIYVVQHLDRLLKQLIQRSKNDEKIELRYSSPDLVGRLQKLSNHLETLAQQADAQPMLSVTNVDYAFLKFAANLFREYGDISERYAQLVENGDLINWRQLSEQYHAASQKKW